MENRSCLEAVEMFIWQKLAMNGLIIMEENLEVLREVKEKWILEN